MYAIRFKNVRRVNISKSPYALWFEVIEGRDSLTGEEVEFVVVLRCYHQQRDITTRSFERPHLFSLCFPELLILFTG